MVLLKTALIGEIAILFRYMWKGGALCNHIDLFGHEGSYNYFEYYDSHYLKFNVGKTI